MNSSPPILMLGTLSTSFEGFAANTTGILGSLVARYLFTSFRVSVRVLGKKDPGFMIMCTGVHYVRMALYDTFVVKKGKLTI